MEKKRLIYTYTADGYDNYESSEYSTRCNNIIDKKLLEETSDPLKNPLDVNLLIAKSKQLEGEKFEIQETGSYRVHFSVTNKKDNITLALLIIDKIICERKFCKLPIRLKAINVQKFTKYSSGREIMMFIPSDKRLGNNNKASKLWVLLLDKIAQAFARYNVDKSEFSPHDKIINYYTSYRLGPNGLLASDDKKVKSFDLVGKPISNIFGTIKLHSFQEVSGPSYNPLNFPDYLAPILSRRLFALGRYNKNANKSNEHQVNETHTV